VQKEIMYKTIVTPKNTILNLSIPAAFVGKKIEVQLFDIEDKLQKETIAKKRKPSDYAGCLSKELAEQMMSDIDKSRNEWV
jgi:hypothetical protein